MTIRDTILLAIEKDIYRRYISVVSLQADGRLELDASCISILSPKLNEEFHLINDKSSIIIARKPIEEHKNRILSKIVFGSGQGNKIKWRMRLSRESLRILLTCKVGFRAFKYGNEVALEAEPFIPPANAYLKDSRCIEDLAPHVLRSSRSILHIHCASNKQKLFPEELGFRLLGDFWRIKYHYNPLTASKEICLGKECHVCSEPYLIDRTDYWYPAIGYHYQQHYARPTLLSFNSPVMTPLARVLAPIYKECKVWMRKSREKKIDDNYCNGGSVYYPGKKLYKISSDKQIKIELVKKDKGLTKEEKGLMKLSFKEIGSFIKNSYTEIDNNEQI